VCVFLVTARESEPRKSTRVFFPPLLERQILNRNEGLAEATLRLPAHHPNHLDALFDAFQELYPLYGPGYFDITVTANVVTQSLRDGRFGVFYGQDFGTGRNGNIYTMGPVQSISDVSEIADLNTDWSLQDFIDVFESVFEDTDVRVSSLINYVYLIRRRLGDFAAQTRVGPRWQLLY
jgi:hypothetical protein